MDEVMSPEELWEYMKNTDDQDKGRRRRSAKAKATRLSMQLTEPNTPNETPLISRPADEFPSIAEVSSRSSLEQEDVSCPCESHEGKLLLDNVFPLSVDEIYDLLFTDCPWFQRFNDLLKNTGYIASPWTTDKDGIRMRTCTYTMALNHAMAPKSCVVTEKQVISHFGRSGDGFIVNKESQNSGIPYANDFVIQCTYCISKITDNEARIKVHGGIIYKKSIWSVVRSYLEKGTYQGLSDHYSALESTLHKECQSRMTRPENEMIASRYDDDSLSSIEDPITDVKPNRVQARKRSRIRETVPLTSTVNATTNTTSTDYAFYIRIIICLLTGLLLLNILMLYRMKHLEMQPTFGEDIVQLLKKVVDQHKVADQTVSLENLLETVNQLTNDLQALKQQVSTKQDL
ncbi:hypothetical protein KIN20_001331 [Parelaphostrongylus tenuis]|uniref:VASt domain-containing protein n=1 Tax=Parelaphostrongylus tenuis TaxID=148309 RepID=A0AAD5MCP3_PARTN|nr:hypothetical protein KIN20_001331 [Parelaphostrongylus tenuis]